MATLSEYELDNRTFDYINALVDTPTGSGAEVPEETYRRVVDVLARILLEVVRQSKCRAKWDAIRVFEKQTVVPCAMATDEKTWMHLELGISFQTIYLRSSLSHFEELRHLDDSFWDLCMSFGKLGTFKYDLGQFPMGFAKEEWERELVKFRNSNIFSMGIDYALLFRHGQTDFSGTDVTLEWKFVDGFRWQKLMPQLVQATELAWRMNYMLYRSAYLKSKRTTQRATVSTGSEEATHG